MLRIELTLPMGFGQVGTSEQGKFSIDSSTIGTDAGFFVLQPVNDLPITAPGILTYRGNFGGHCVYSNRISSQFTDSGLHKSILVSTSDTVHTSFGSDTCHIILGAVGNRLTSETISRVSNSKYVQTNYGIYPLKFFFSDGYTTEDGEEMSVREIRKILKECIDSEDKKKPLTDDELAEILKEKGYPIARRTVAKYRQQLNIPVARLRK